MRLYTWPPILVFLLVLTALPRPAITPPAEPPTLEQAAPQTDPADDPEVVMMSEMHHRQLSYIIDQITALRARRQMVWRIDTWLAQRGSPMAGCGECYVANGERTGIPPALSVAIAEAESSSGLACFAPRNAWGMLAFRGGWATWEEGIAANFDWLARYFGCPQSSYDCPGYCVPDHPWMEGVDRVQRFIEGMDAGEVY